MAATTKSSGISLSRQDRILAGTIALLLGVFMLFGVAFAQPDLLHNAAHDTRHAISAPCH